MARSRLLLRWCYLVIAFILLVGRYVHGAAPLESEVIDDGEVVRRLQAQLEQDISQHKCVSETGASSLAHEDVLHRMDGKKLVYIGDSVTRYQYLELAYYLTHGRCPDLYSSEYGYIMQEKTFSGFTEFYKNSSAAMTVKRAPIETHETCMCARSGLLPGQVQEHRHFTYQDVQGRNIEMIYLQYFREDFDQFATLTSMAENLQATDVLMNFGVWLRNTNSTCGDNAGDQCTNIPALCKYLQADQPFKVWWITSAPTSFDKTVADRLPQHLDVPARCQLHPESVLNRTAALYTLEPNATLRYQNYWHWAHLHAEANHAFNRQFVGRLAKSEQLTRLNAQQRWRRTHVWKQIFASR